MKYLLAALLTTVAALSGAAETESARLLGAARLAGTEASALVFKGDAGAHPDDSRGTRVSGKSLVLATAIASAAAITVAWLLRPRSECEPTNGALTYEFFRLWIRASTPPPVPPVPEGVTPPPIAVPPPPPLPELCVPRGTYR